MIVDVHVHFLSPHALDAARRTPARFGVRVLDDGERPRLAVGDEPPTRPLLEPLYTLAAHRGFLDAQGIDTAVFGPLMDVAGYSLPPGPAAAWSRAQNEGLAQSLAEAGRDHAGLATVPLQDPTLAADELRAAVRSLLDRGADVDSVTNGRFPWTPLMHAAWKGHLGTCRLLLDRGANPCAEDLDSFTPITLAAAEGHWGVVKLLAEHGASGV